MSVTEEDWDKRRLCPDGACVGVIGDDGACSVCGLESGEDVAARHHDSVDDEDDDDDLEDDEGDEDEGEDEGEEDVAAAGSELDDDDRVLCPDGTCVGLIGADGTCKVCGARARE
jgi:hypothetical protein